MELRAVIKLMMIEKKDIYLSIVFGFLAGISAVALFSNSGYLISKAVLLPPLYVLTISIAFLKLFSVIRALSRYAERYYSHRATFTILSRLRTNFFEKLEPHAATIFHKYRSGELLARIVGDVESLQNFFLRVFYPPIVMILVFLATIVLTSFFSITVACVLLVGLGFTGFFVPLLFAIRRRGLETKLRELRGQLSTETTEFMFGFLDLKLYQKLQDREVDLIQASNVYVDKQADSSLKILYSLSINHVIALLITWLVLGLSAYLVLANELDGVFMAMLVLIGLTVFESSIPMAAFPIFYEDSRRAASRLFSVVNEEEAFNQDNQGEIKSRWDYSKAPSIEVKKLSFQFPGEKRLALNQLTFTIPAGSKTAIVGPSGSGKSVLLGLLLKFYKNFEGEISLGGENFTKLDEENVWMGVNPVLQSNHFFCGSVRDNLCLARDGVSEADMLEVLSKVLLDHLTLDDPILEKGDNLSGGEKQRLAMARAMLKGSHLWLLDEPTSSIDALTERDIFNHIFTENHDDTIIIVSHRLSGLEQFDQIIVIEDGSIVESGTYKELIEKKGYFYEMKQIEKSVFL